jgi:hypothetical protein
MTSVVAAYCSGTMMHAAFHASLTNVIMHEVNEGPRHITAPGGGTFGTIGTPRIATARNGIVRAFLESSEAEWLWMLDTDMVFRPDALERLLEFADPAETPILGGLCFGMTLMGEIFPTLYICPDDGTKLQHMFNYPKDTIMSVAATGAACLLLHRGVLEDMGKNFEHPREWFSDQIWNGQDMGEDMTFCFRARELGYPVKVHTGLRIGHVKPWIVDEKEFDKYVEDFNGD